MPFPEFESDKARILFFSRGRGRGHAIPDLAIAAALGRIRADVDIRFVSYGTGAGAIREAGVPLVDLKLPETGPIVEMSVLAGKLIGWLDPDLVVSHEEFAAVPSARIFDKPALVLTDWFTDFEMYSMGTLRFADRVLFLGQPGVFPEPPWLSGRIEYLGPLLRDFEYRPGDRLRARAGLGLPPDAVVLGVFPGSWREADTPLLEPLIAAFAALDVSPRRLLWLAGADYGLVRDRLAGNADTLVIERTWNIDQLMVACDVAITKSNRRSVIELTSLNVPTIAVTWELNPADDTVVAALPGVARLGGAGLEPQTLGAAIRSLLSDPPIFRGEMPRCTPEECARLILAALDRALLKSRRAPG